MAKADDTLRRFWNFCQQRHLPQAVLMAIPYIGSSIETIIYGGATEDLIKQVQSQTIEHQREIASRLEAIMTQMAENAEYIVTIGGGNWEHVLQLDDVLHLGQKYKATSHEVLGGSGLNYTLRLINAGYPVLPILSIGKDRLGRKIREELLISARRAVLPEEILTFINSDEFFVASMKTPFAVNVVEKGQRRTIIAESLYGCEHFKDYVEHRLAYLDTQLVTSIKAVVIGHIYADDPDLNSSHYGQCTKSIIRSFRGKCPIFCNFGDSQIRMGADFWENDLNGVSVFQLNLEEMRRLFAQENARVPLVDIVEWLKGRRITAVITLDRFGAIATYKDGTDGMILAWPFELENMVDPTGAGDAFGAGLVAKLYQKPDFSFTDFFDAIGEARIWAAYACTTLGGGSNCPDRRSLQEFREGVLARQRDPVEIQPIKNLDRILRILDKAYEWSQ